MDSRRFQKKRRLKGSILGIKNMPFAPHPQRCMYANVVLFLNSTSSCRKLRANVHIKDFLFVAIHKRVQLKTQREMCLLALIIQEKI